MLVVYTVPCQMYESQAVTVSVFDVLLLIVRNSDVIVSGVLGSDAFFVSIYLPERVNKLSPHE